MSVRESIVSQAETLKKGLSEANPKQAKGAFFSGNAQWSEQGFALCE